MSAELTIILLNTTILYGAYTQVFPKVAGNDLMKLAKNDLIAMLIPLAIVGSIFMHSEREFSMFLFDTNWFWFTLVTYFLIEVPFGLWYMKRIEFP
jgi:hypothetical protein